MKSRKAFGTIKLKDIVLVAAIAHAVAQLLIFFPMEWNQPASILHFYDMAVYWRAAQAVLHGHSPYTPIPYYTPTNMPPGYIYSPAFLAFVMPFTKLTLYEFHRVWLILITACYWGYAACLSYLRHGSLRPSKVLEYGLYLALFPFFEFFGLRGGQADVIILLMAGLAFCFPKAQGFLLGICPQIKPAYVWLVCSLALKSWRVGALAMVSLCVGVGFAVALCGPHIYARWLYTIAPLSQGCFQINNISISMLTLRLAQWLRIWHYDGQYLALMPKLWLDGLAVAAPLAVWWKTRKMSVNTQSVFTLITAVLFNPICWVYYLPNTLLGYVIYRKDNLASAAD